MRCRLCDAPVSRSDYCSKCEAIHTTDRDRARALLYQGFLEEIPANFFTAIPELAGRVWVKGKYARPLRGDIIAWREEIWPEKPVGKVARDSRQRVLNINGLRGIICAAQGEDSGLMLLDVLYVRELLLDKNILVKSIRQGDILRKRKLPEYFRVEWPDEADRAWAQSKAWQQR